MALILSDLDYLTSTKGEHLLEELRYQDLSEKNALTLVTHFRKSFAAAEVRAGVYLAQLRKRAESKYGERAHHMYFTDDALQQASDPLISRYRAGKMSQPRVVDMCCGVGGDLLGFGEAGITTQGVDLDPVRVAMARLNVQEFPHITVNVGDVTEPFYGDSSGVFFDPARRDESGKRIFDVRQYIPPLDTIFRWDVPQIVVKLSPGIDLDQLAEYPGNIEFISVSGELKEAVLWYRQFDRRYTATLFHNGQTLHWTTQNERSVGLDEPQQWLIEPDPSIIRAGYVQDVAAEFQGTLLDESIAYFTTSDYPNTVWVKAWRIQDWMPFQLKRLRAYLRERNIGRVTVKKRGSPLTPESLIPKLKLKGEHTATLVLTQHYGNPIVMICDEMPELH